jgi:hypothetical protein
MSKNLLFILVAVLIVGGIGLFFWFSTPAVTQTGSPPNNTYTGPPVTTGATPGSQNSAATLTVNAISGSPIAVNDFTKSPQTVITADIPGHYFLAGGTNAYASGAPYSIYYVSKDQSFNITLLAEPLADNRSKAEQELVQKLGIPKITMCRLRYYVSVPNDVNATYAGKNLGFSFCPGATQL